MSQESNDVQVDSPEEPLSQENGQQNGPHRTSQRRALFYQVALGLIANFGSLSPGMTFGYSAVAIPQMMNPKTKFQITEDQASWLASLASISTATGCLLSGPLMDKLGRRAALLSFNVPATIGWLLIAFAYGDATLGLIYAGRILTGLAAGMASAPPPVYSAEIGSNKLRGMLVTWTSISVALGILLVYVLGTIIADDWRLIAGISATFPILSFLLTFFFLLESPVWLSGRGRHEEAIEILKKVKPDEASTTTNPAQNQQGKPSLLKIFFTAATLKPFLVMNLFFFFQQFSGTFVVVFYAIDIVKEAGVGLDPYIAAVLIGVARFVVTICVSFIANKYGKRPPAIVSGAGMTLCMGCLAVYLYLSASNTLSKDTLDSLSWFPVVSLVLYIVTSTIGFLTLPWAMMGEVYPANVRGFAAGITTFLAYFFNFVIIKLYPFMLHTLQRYGLFFFYGGVSVLGTLFVFFFLPETTGKNLEEIEEQFRRKSKSKLAQIEEEEPLQDDRNNAIVVKGST